MNLVVEIGNTALKAAWVDGKTFGKTYRYQGERMVDFIISVTEREKPEVITVASVNDISPADIHRLESVCGLLLLLDPHHVSALQRYGLPDYLSYDRAAALIAAKSMFCDKPCTVVDFGTVMNVDFISADGKYEGGNISVGCRTRFKALNRYSKTLPLVNTPLDTDVIGQSLVSSIESGVISGIVFEIQSYIDSRPDNIVIFTGGDANYFVKKMKNSIFVICNLVLMGLVQITDDYVKELE